VEVKIGVVDSPRELTVDSGQTPQEIQSLVSDTLKKEEAVLALTDVKGRQIMIPSSKIAYVEIGPADAPRVGFGVE
jgi:Mg2+/Co2+ transporter CorC